MIVLHKKEGIKASEIFQSLDIKFAFVKKINKNEYSQVHMEIKCRDFLGDCIWSREKKKEVNIYNFKYSFEKDPYDTRKTRLSLKFPDEESMVNFKNNFQTLNHIEDDYEMSPSKWKETNDKQTLIVESSSLWQSCVWKMSYYSYLLKILSYKDMNTLAPPEKDYAVLLDIETKHKLMKNIRNKREILKDDMRLAHNNSGFVSILKNYNPVMNKILLGGK